MLNTLLKSLLIMIIFIPTLSLAKKSSGNFFKGFEIHGGLELPTQMGVRGKFKLPKNFYAIAGVGYAPSFLINMNTGMASTFGSINSHDAKILDAALNNSFYIDVKAGWHFDSSEEGFFIEGGYSMMNGSGDKVNITAIRNVTGGIYTGIFNTDTYELSSLIHNLTLHGGYNWTLWENWRLSLDVGVVKPLSSSTSISFSRITAANDQIESDLSSSIEDLFSSYFIFKSGVWLGYIF